MSAQQHGAVAGRAVGAGNTSSIETAAQQALGDPADDRIGTWRIQPADTTGLTQDEADELAYHRAFDLDVPRAVAVGTDRWALVDPACRYSTENHTAILTDRAVAAWPHTTATMVAAAAALRERRTSAERPTPGEPSRLLHGEEDERLFR